MFSPWSRKRELADLNGTAALERLERPLAAAGDRLVNRPVGSWGRKEAVARWSGGVTTRR